MNNKELYQNRFKEYYEKHRSEIIQKTHQYRRNHIEWYRAYYRQQYQLKKTHREYRNLANSPIYVEVNPLLYFDE